MLHRRQLIFPLYRAGVREHFGGTSPLCSRDVLLNCSRGWLDVVSVRRGPLIFLNDAASVSVSAFCHAAPRHTAARRASSRPTARAANQWHVDADTTSLARHKQKKQKQKPEKQKQTNSSVPPLSTRSKREGQHKKNNFWC